MRHALKQVKHRAAAWLRVVPAAPSGPPPVSDYDRVYRTLRPSELNADPGPLDAGDVLLDLFDARRREHRFLGFYSPQGGNLALERYGFLPRLRDKGFDPVLSVDLSDPNEHHLWIHDGPRASDNLLVELAVGFRHLALPDGEACRMLFINWLLMQDPRASFSPGEPPLPEQQRPGLGLFLQFGHLLRLMATRLGCDGLLNHPAHFHNAVLYGKVMSFMDPEAEGRFRALERDLRDLTLTEAANAVDERRVFGADGEAVAWEPLPQVMPISQQARAWFESAAYRKSVAQALASNRFEAQPPQERQTA